MIGRKSPPDERLTNAFRVGLTGGIASGKSTIASEFERLGAVLIDTDVIARDVVAAGTDGLDEIVDHFGNSILTTNGDLDRRALREIVFSDAKKRILLESIVHPRIRAETIRQMNGPGIPYQIIVVPLLVDSPLRALVDRVLVVDCSEEVQMQRLLLRDSESRKQAERMIAAQSTRAERLALADDVVDNSGDMNSALRQVRLLHKKYLSLTK